MTGAGGGQAGWRPPFWSRAADVETNGTDGVDGAPVPDLPPQSSVPLEELTAKVRVINIYATKWLHRENATRDAEPSFELGRLRDFYNYFQDQLPRPLLHRLIEPQQVTFGAGDCGERDDALASTGIVMAECWLFGLPADQVVAAVTFDLASPLLTQSTSVVCEVLERSINPGVAIGGVPLAEYIAVLAEDVGVEAIEGETVALLPERHQIVFAENVAGVPAPDSEVVKEILFRNDPPYREEFTRMVRPKEMNQPPRTLGAVTPYASFLYGHQHFVQDSVFLSTVQAVGTASRFRQIWREAHRRVREFRHDHQEQDVGIQQRRDLEDLVDRLGNLEFDLTFSVEFPLMRIESFHSALYQAMDLQAQADTLSRMFTQLAGSIRSEIMAIDIRDRAWEDRKQRWNAVAASVLSIIGVPIGFLVAFFGVNATQVRADRSMFDHHYLGAYGFSVLVALVPVMLILYPHLRRRSWRRRNGDDGTSAARRGAAASGIRPVPGPRQPRPASGVSAVDSAKSAGPPQ
ncbi:MAG: hypothetical protein JXA67_00420 [Micromonosporaceae bacterium]|nr:hypothetical protein [Micromonosporaceae bacterium]